ncbi:MAG: threonylcarbamoyl-AMP synthase [Alphaproteobacteria bacterium]|nr:threonylcarbamoyl-AMP synthase [Alphaproteobacteria bacterium]
MIVLPPDESGIRIAADHLLAGGILGMPTETVYGLAAVVWRTDAIASVFAAKERPLFDPLIAHVVDVEQAWTVWDRDVLEAPAREAVERLTAALWPGPLTLVLPRREAVPDLATSGLPTAAVRSPDHPVARSLIAAVGEPLVAPSANRFGRVSPTTAEAVVAELGDRVPYVLDGGPCRVGLESTVLAIEPDGVPRLLRPGGVAAERVAELLGRPVRDGRGGAIEAPGQLASHYAPSVPLTLVDRAEGELGRVSALLASGSADRVRADGSVVVLSEGGDAAEAARRLFAALRELDGAGLPIVAERWPDRTGLGHAIADRLERAAARRP